MAPCRFRSALPSSPGSPRPPTPPRSSTSCWAPRPSFPGLETSSGCPAGAGFARRAGDPDPLGDLAPRPLQGDLHPASAPGGGLDDALDHGARTALRLPFFVEERLLFFVGKRFLGGHWGRLG